MITTKIYEHLMCDTAEEALEECSGLGGRLGRDWINAKLAEIEADYAVNEGPARDAFGEIIRERRTVTGMRVLEGVYAIRKAIYNEDTGRFERHDWFAGYQVWIQPKMYGDHEFDVLTRMFDSKYKGREYADALVRIGGGEAVSLAA